MNKGLWFLVAILFFVSCTPEVKINEEIPDSRSFYMGFTAFPYDLTLEALEETYRHVGEDGDILLTHLDAGVPWEEALEGKDYPSVVSETLQEALDALGDDQKLLISATPTASTRNTLARYWNNEGEHQALPADWEAKAFNDSEVITAFINYCKYIIDFATPDYFAYAIEINNSFERGSDNFVEFLKLAEEVYSELRFLCFS